MMMSGLNGMKELELVKQMQKQVHCRETSIHPDLLLADKRRGDDFMHGYAFQFGTENIDIIFSIQICKNI